MANPYHIRRAAARLRPFLEVDDGPARVGVPVTLKQRVFELLDVRPEDRGFGRALNIGLLGLIVLNVVAVILETVAPIRAAFGPAFKAFETFSVVVFTAEYVARLWSCTVDPRFSRPVRGRLRFATSFMGIVDLVAILPSLIPGGLLDLRVVRVLRLMRVLRLLKVARYSQSLQALGRVLTAKRDELVVTAIAGSLLLICASSLMYYAENKAQPEVFSSIPAAMWWGVETLTTVGYGDLFPVTPIGKVMGSVIAVLGIGLFALPAGILASGFSEELRRSGARQCPHCGGQVD
jgi:voltage-gated potassium channel